MLVERGAQRVVSFDICPPRADAIDSPRVEYIEGDLTNPTDVNSACEGMDCVFHIAALVGPYHADEMYVKVNYDGTKNILDACRLHNVNKIVMSSSPSTRFPYPDPNIDGLTEDDLIRVNGGDYAPVFLQPYAKTKAMGEKLIRDACGSEEGDLLTIAVAPHQVYGPRDGLFLPSLLAGAAPGGGLRIFGDGENRISMCHVDNYCHGLVLGAEAIVAMGFDSLWDKFHLPGWFMMLIGYLTLWMGNLFAMLTGTPKHVVNFKLKLNPFAVKMLLIHRYIPPSRSARR
ncbi:Nsdhl [Symbiodinium microadriaticum]|nr:Nsdhl [Symbiodinium microadriaticum]